MFGCPRIWGVAGVIYRAFPGRLLTLVVVVDDETLKNMTLITLPCQATGAGIYTYFIIKL
jgi:hypothetical protein